jgi:GNAT superfamily N-acetyltransferase
MTQSAAQEPIAPNSEYLRTTPDGYEIRGEITERQMLALHALWAAWIEAEGAEFHPDVWVAYMQHMVQSGRWFPLVAYDGDEPVGMVECLWQMDPFDGKKTGQGDHAYVLPEHRTAGLFTEMVAAMSDVADMWGTETEVLAVAMDAQFLVPLYEKYGFKVSGTLMRRKHD